MKHTHLKKLAHASVQNDTVDKSIVNFVVNKLSKNDIKVYMNYLKNELATKVITVISSDPISKDIQDKLQSKFPQQTINFSVDESLGAGIYLQANDMVLDSSIRGIISATINKLAKSL